MLPSHNKPSSTRSRDQEQLTIELGELQLDGFDLSLTGFDDAELAGPTRALVSTTAGLPRARK
jgi:hypothetical protein